MIAVKILLLLICYMASATEAYPLEDEESPLAISRVTRALIPGKLAMALGHSDVKPRGRSATKSRSRGRGAGSKKSRGRATGSKKSRGRATGSKKSRGRATGSKKSRGRAATKGRNSHRSKGRGRGF